MIKFFSHGKTFTYWGIHGFERCKSISHSHKMGQCIDFQSNDSKTLKWESLDNKNLLWFNATIIFRILLFQIQVIPIFLTIGKGILKTIRDQNNSFSYKTEEWLKPAWNLTVIGDWELPPTLISNLAQWSQTNPYTYSQIALVASGYDIACATSKSPLIYRKDKTQPHIEACKFDPRIQI